MKLIDHIAHRPYPLPSKAWVMRQVWENVLFLHWPVSPDALRPFVPSPLRIDTFDQTAWIGIVAFRMKGIYFRGLPAISVVPSFSEMNVRTYVSFDGKPGVYFMSLDVDDWASLNIAKKWYRLPYHRAQLSTRKAGSAIHYRNSRTNGSVGFTGICTPKREVYFPKTGTLDHWLTERYRFYTMERGRRIFYGDIHHEPWPLQKAEINIYHNTLFAPFHIDLSTTEPIAHFSKGVESLMWNCKRLGVYFD